MKRNAENYTVRIEVRDENGKLILDEYGNKQISFSYEVEMLTENVEFNLRHLANTMKTWMPKRKINIEASVFNTISRTYMTMFSFYVEEDRFIKH
jgi:hypothetical protein